MFGPADQAEAAAVSPLEQGWRWNLRAPGWQAVALERLRPS
jgi:hypothetical protein